MNDPFILGVNYWPRCKAMDWWSNFDPGEVREEFAIIKELGLSLVRIFLLWDDFQPDPDSICRSCLHNLAAVCDLAEAAGLQLDITFFTGHMSGPNWAPGWLVGGPPAPGNRQVVSAGRVVQSGYRNFFTDEQARRAARIQIQNVVGALKDHPAVAMWNLGNEPDLFALPPDAKVGLDWAREMADLIRSLDKERPVTCGLHIASLLQDNGLRVEQIFGEMDLAVMHTYPMYMGDMVKGPLDPDFVPFTCALTEALCGKPVLMEEFGGCTAPEGLPSLTWEWTGYGRPFRQFMAGEEDLAAYIEQVLPRLQETGATGAVLWCFADYHPSLWNRPPCRDSRHERFFGLVRPDGSIKPHARVLQKFAATQPEVASNPRRIKLSITPDEYYQDAGVNLRLLYQAWLSE